MVSRESSEYGELPQTGWTVDQDNVILILHPAEGIFEKEHGAELGHDVRFCDRQVHM